MGKQTSISFKEEDFTKKTPDKNKKGPLRIDFTLNWNRKLNNTIFSTIRPKSEKYNKEQKYVVYLAGSFYCECKVIHTEILTIKTIIERNYHLLDTGKDKSFFIDLMKNMYGKNTWWKSENTEMNYILLEKIEQLSIFD